MWAEEDKQRLLEAAYDIDALEDVTRLTRSGPFQRAASITRDTLAEARVILEQAVAEDVREASETDSARRDAEQALTKARARYRYVRDRVRSALLDPDLLGGRDDHATRYARYRDIFGDDERDEWHVDDELDDHLRAVITALEEHDELAALDLTERMRELRERVAEAQATLQRETREDLEAHRDLRLARMAFDRAYRAHVLQVEAVLTYDDRLVEIGCFLKDHQPDYAARRRAGISIDEEPDIDELADRLGWR